jgi:two-component system, OmpR family, response regulator RpaA
MTLAKDVLTTGEVAKICNVAPRTVSKWFDTGQLKGYRIPGSKDRRIPVSALINFMKDHGIPLDGLQTGQIRVLLVDDDDDVTSTLGTLLSDQTEYEIKSATDAFEAGVTCGQFKPHVMLLDLHISGGDAQRVADLVRNNPELQLTKIIAMSGKLTDGQAMQLRRQGFDAFLKKPFQFRQVIEAIEQATNIVQ